MVLESTYLERAATGPGGLFYGVYPALVTEVLDPDKQGRVRVKLPCPTLSVASTPPGGR